MCSKQVTAIRYYNNLPYRLAHTLQIRCAIAQMVSHQLPTMVALVQPPSSKVMFVVDKVTLGHVFSKSFLLPILILHSPHYLGLVQ
jgi:hypothetical protein